MRTSNTGVIHARLRVFVCGRQDQPPEIARRDFPGCEKLLSVSFQAQTLGSQPARLAGHYFHAKQHPERLNVGLLPAQPRQARSWRKFVWPKSSVFVFDPADKIVL